MTLTHNQKIYLALTALLFSTLACRTATRLIIPDTPTPQPTPTITLTPTPAATFTPTITPTATAYEASCPSTLTQIIKDSVVTDHVIHGNETSSDQQDVTYLVHYAIVNDQLKSPHLFSVKKNLADEQKDEATHQAIWEYFTRLIPAERRDILTGFTIFTDGPDNYLAAVSQSDNSAYKWDLNVDIADASPKTALTFTLIHESGHLLTLNPDQVQVDLDIYDNPGNEDIYQKAVDSCPQYFTGEGCSNSDSYINEFFNRFWPDLYAEWQSIDQEENQRTRDNLLERFYKTYQDQFLSDYAPTSPSEDIAESFTYFVLSPKPENNSIANEKILFFYEYPELIDLRKQILEKICVEFPQ